METRQVSPLGWLAIALIMAVVLMGVLGAVTMAGYSGSYGMMGGNWGWGLAMIAVPGVILVVILLAALGGLGETAKPAPYPAFVPPPASASEILDQRYARGELNSEEYHRMRADLVGGRAPPVG